MFGKSSEHSKQDDMLEPKWALDFGYPRYSPPRLSRWLAGWRVPSFLMREPPPLFIPWAPPHLPSSPSGARREAFTIIALAWSTQHYPRLVADWSAARSWDPIQEYEERLPSDPELAAASQGSRPSLEASAPVKTRTRSLRRKGDFRVSPRFAASEAWLGATAACPRKVE